MTWRGEFFNKKWNLLLRSFFSLSSTQFFLLLLLLCTLFFSVRRYYALDIEWKLKNKSWRERKKNNSRFFFNSPRTNIFVHDKVERRTMERKSLSHKVSVWAAHFFFRSSSMRFLVWDKWSRSILPQWVS